MGRGALGNPWLFAGRERPQTLAGRLPLLHRYLALCEAYLPVERLLFRIRNQVCRFLAGLNGAATARQKVLTCTTKQHSFHSLLVRLPHPRIHHAKQCPERRRGS